jgi:hypothetical protein
MEEDACQEGSEVQSHTVSPSESPVCEQPPLVRRGGDADSSVRCAGGGGGGGSGGSKFRASRGLPPRSPAANPFQ